MRLPSVARANQRLGIAIDNDIDLKTDDAESDVMLGERAGTGTNSNGSNGNNGSEDRNSNNNSATVVASRY